MKSNTTPSFNISWASVRNLLMLLLFFIGAVSRAQTPVAFYPFAGNANDAAGTNNGLVNGAILVADRFGNATSAYSFDGVDDYITFSQPWTTITDNFAISAWLKPNVLGGAILSNGQNSYPAASPYNGYSLKFTARPVGELNGVASFNGGVDVIATGNWFHIVLVRENGIAKLYVNGILQPNTIANAPNTPSESAIIGSLNSGSDFVNGIIDDVKIFNIALTAEQVLTEYSSNSGQNYRSSASGNWSAPSTWEVFNGTSFVAATIAPSSAAGIITIRNGHNVTINNGVTVDQVVVEAGGILTQSATATITLDNGTGDDLTIDGTMNCQGGTIQGQGNVSILQNGVFNFLAVNSATLAVALNNTGTINWQNGIIYFINTPTITNNGTWNITGNNSTQQWFSNCNIVNNGSIFKTSSGTTTFGGINSFGNQGILNLNAGTLLLNSGTFTNTGNLTFNSGILTVGPACTFNHNGGSTINGNGNFNNNGTFNLNINQEFSPTLLFSNTGTVNGSGNLVINHTFIFSGTIKGAGTLTLNENVTWNGGILARTASLAAGKTINLVTNASKTFEAGFTNNGTFNWEDGIIYFINTPTITNNGTWNITGNSSTQQWSSSGNLINNGSIFKTSSGTTTFGGINNFGNQGILNLNAGTLLLNSGTFTNTGNLTLNSGILTVGAGCTFNHNGGSTINGNGNFNNAGTFNLNINREFGPSLTFSNTGTVNGSGNLVINHSFIFSGTIKGEGTLTLNENATWNGGTLARTASLAAGKTISLATSASKTFEAGFTNNGTLNWDDGIIYFINTPTITNNGTWNINGNSSTQQWSSTGNLINNGSILKTSSGTTTFGGINSFGNQGILNLNAGTILLNSGTFNNTGNLTLNSGILTVGSAGTFNHNGGSTINGNGNFNNAGTFNLNINREFGPSLTFSNTGTVNGSGNLVINHSFIFSGTIKGEGTLTLNENATWNGGTLARTASLAAGKVISFATSTSKTFEAGFTNDGTLNWEDGIIYFINTPTITNNGTWNITGNNSTQQWSSSGNLINNGSIVKTSSGTTTLNGFNSFSNPGRINLNAGTLLLNSGTFNNSGNLTFNSGILTVGAGCTFNHNIGSVIGGNGSFTNNGNFNLNINQEFNPSLIFSNTGTVNGSGNLVINNDFTFSGIIQGAGLLELNENGTWNGGTLRRALVVETGKALYLSTSASKTLEVNLTNDGTLNWQDGIIYFINTPTITNNGTWNITGNNTTQQWTSSGNLINNGSIVKSSSGTTSFNGLTTFTNNPNASIGGIGTISCNATTFTNNGNITPGSSATGILTFNSNQPLATGSALNIQILDGSGPGTGHDQLIRNGNLTLAGSLFVTETGSVPNGTYTIIQLTSGSITGNFGYTELPAGYELIVGASMVALSRNAPSIACPSDRVITAPSGQCSAVVNNIDPAIESGLAFTYNLSGATTGSGTGSASGSTFNTGVTVVTYALASNPADKCSFSVTVNNSAIPSVSISATATSVCVGGSVSFTALPVNGGTPTYHWKINGQPVGSNSAVLQSGSFINGDVVNVEMTSSLPCAVPAIVTSNSITITVNETVTPSVSISTATTEICQGFNTTFSATPVNGGSSPSYQWKVNGVNAGSNSAIFTTNTLNDGDLVSVIMSTSLQCITQPTATSNSITVNVSPAIPTSVTIATGTTEICAGTMVSFTALAVNGGNPAYQWKRNGQNVGTNSAVYIASNLLNGDLVYVLMTSDIPCAINPAQSNSVQMTVNSLPVVIITGPQNLCENGTATLTATQGVSYLWNTGATTQSVSISASGTYSVVVTNSKGCSGTVTFVLNPPPSPVGQFSALMPADSSYGIQEPITFLWTAAANATAYDFYLWRTNQPRPATPTLAGLTATSYTHNDYLNKNYLYNWQVVARNSCYQVETAPRLFSFFIFTDLKVEPFAVAASALAGETIPVAFTVKNTGSVSTGIIPWKDEVFISSSPVFDPGTATKLVSLNNISPLYPGQNYVNSANITLPVYQEGTTWVFVKTDANNIIQETDESNNVVVSTNAIEVNLPPYPDMTVSNIQSLSGNIIPGQNVTVGWNVDNTGDAAAVGGWSQRISLISGSQVQILGFVQNTETVPALGGVSLSTSFMVPDQISFEGDVFIQVRLTPNPSLIEKPNGAANNTVLSAESFLLEKHLTLSLPTATLYENSPTVIQGMLHRSGNRDNPLVANFSVTLENRLNIPVSVTIPANQASALFEISAIDNTLIEGNFDVIISAIANGYPTNTKTVTIIDNEVPALTAYLNVTEATEGQVFQLTLSRDLVTGNALIVSLLANRANQINLPVTATIEAGQASTTLQIQVINNTTPELTEAVTINASAVGFTPASTSVTILDNDIPQITLTINPDMVSEAGGSYASFGTVQLAEPANGNLVIKISSVQQGQLYFPGQVTIPDGQLQKQFNIGVVDNSMLDGNRVVELTAAVFIPSCGCGAPSGTGGISMQNITILDNDGPALSASASPFAVPENIVNAGFLTITRNTPGGDEISVTLENNGDDEILMASSAIIPQDANSVSVPFSTVDDGIEDGNQIVSVTVSSSGYSSGSCWIMVSDRNLPDYLAKNLTLSRNSLLINETVEISCEITNEGYSMATSGAEVKIYLSSDQNIDNSDVLLSTQYTQSALSIGQSLEINHTFIPTEGVGNFFILANVNASGAKSELIAINNTTNTQVLAIFPDYNATAFVDGAVFNGTTPITIHGVTETVVKSPAANKAVDVYVVVNGARRVLNAVSNDNGEFSISFIPLNGEAGDYYVGACYPGQSMNEAQDNFVILGAKHIAPGFLAWDLFLDEAKTFTLDIQNTSSLDVNNVQVQVLSAPPGFAVNFLPIGNLPGNATLAMSYTVTASEVTIGNSYQEVKLQVVTDEGTKFRFSAWFFSRAMKGNLKLTPVALKKTMVRGMINYAEFEILNNGMAQTGEISILLPELEWLSLATGSAVIPSLAPGQTAAVTLKLMPGNDLQLNNPITGQLALNATNANSVNLPFTFEPVSVETGSLLVDVTDEYTYNTQAEPHLAGASVSVLHPYTGQVIAQGTTDAGGHFLAQNINEGYYSLRVSAPKHESYTDIIFIEKGTVNTEVVFISFQAISYSWEVEPTQIQDQYEINLIVTFETNVPAPVVVMNLPDTMPQLSLGQVFPFIVTVTNYGLITAQDSELRFPADEEYEFVANVNMIDVLPQTTVQIPVIMKRKDSGKAGSGGKCADYMVFSYKFECGPENRVSTAVDEVKFEGRYCSNATLPLLVGICLDCGGPGYVGGGGPYGGGFFPIKIPTAPYKKNNKACDPCLAEFLNAAWDCSPVPNFFFSQTPAKSGVTITGNTVKSGYGLYKEITDILDQVKCVYNIGHSLGCKINNEFFKKQETGSKAGVAQEIITSQADLFMVDRSLQSIIGIIAESYNDSLLVARQDFPVFHDSVSFFAETFIPIDETKQNQLLELFSNTDIPSQEMTGYFNRWNSTVEAWNLGIHSPTSEYPNIIDSAVLFHYALHFDTAMIYTIDRNFASVGEMYNNAFEIVKGYTDQVSNSVCATVTVQFSQTLTMTREAFEGTLTIFNGHESDAMKNISLELEVRDENANISNDLFQINTKSLDQISGIDGSGLLDAQAEGTAVIQFIPERGAAPDVPRYYSFGGKLSYLDPFTGEIFEQLLLPVTLQVNPSPNLYIDYFMQRDILGDDALTGPIEPSIPAELAVMIDNQGAGTAFSVTVESAQPVIVENEKGLLIDFTIIGSNFGGKPRNLGLLDVNFGDIEGGKTAVGQWWFTSSLLGHFIAYEVSVNHLNSFGNPDLSLVSSVEVHELIRSALVYGVFNDSINDFLVNDYPDRDDIPDALYYSNGTVAQVYEADTAQVDGLVSLSDLSIDLTVTPHVSGWNFTRLGDPGNGYYKIVSCTRDDGQEIPLNNIWLSNVTIPDGGEPIYENKLHFLDIFNDLAPRTYTVVFEPMDLNVPEVVAINGVPQTPVNQPLSNVQVVFNKPVNPLTFNDEDMILKNQGGPDLMDSTVLVTRVNDTIYDVNFADKTSANGFYTLTVQAAGITDLIGNYGLVGKQTSWIQSISVPAIDYFFGLPEIPGAPIDTLLVLFNMPITPSTFTASQLTLIDGEGNNLPTSTLVISSESFNNVLFKISGLMASTSGNGNYELIFKLTEILGETGQFGILDQSVNWNVCQVPPPTANAGMNASVCIGANYQLNGSVTNAGSFVWSTSGSGTFDHEQILNPVYTPGESDFTAGSVQLTLTALPANSCTSSVQTSMTLTFIKGAEANAGSNAVICQNTTHQLFGTVTNSGGSRWITSGNGTFSNSNSLTPVYSPGTEDISNGVVQLSLIAEPLSPCVLADTSSMMLTIQKLPTAYAGANQTVCENQPIQLLAVAQNYSSLLWTGGGSGIFSDRTILNPVYTPGELDIERGYVTFLFTAQASNPCFTRAFSVVRYDIVKKPVANAGADATICENGTHQLSGIAQNQSSVLWTTSGNGTFGSAGSLSTVYTPGAADILAGSATLTLTASAVSPCLVSASDFKILQIQKMPIVNSGLDATICENGTHQLAGTAQNQSSVLWTTSGNGTFSSASSLTPVYTPGTMEIAAGTVTLTLTAIAISPCLVSASDSKILQIQKMPIVNSGLDATICENGTHQLAGIAQNQSSVLWTTSGNGTFSSAGSLTTVYTPGTTEVAAGTVTLTLTASAISPCQVSASDTKILQIQKLPTVNSGLDVTICENGTHQLSGTSQNQSSVLWTTSGNGTFGSASSPTTVYTPGVADITSGAVTLTLTASAVSPCLLSASDSKILQIQKLPIVNSGLDATICENETHQLEGTAQNQSSVLWTTSGNGTFGSAGSPTTVYTPGTTEIAAGTVTLTLTASAVSPCLLSASDTKILQIQKLPTVNSGLDATICENGTHQLSGTAQNQSSVLWTTSGNGTFSSASSLNPVYTPGTTEIASGTVTLTLTTSAVSPCLVSASDNQILQIQKLPVVNSGLDATICENGTHQLSGTAQNQSSVLWTTSGNGTFGSAGSLTTIYTPGTSEIAAGTVTLTLTASTVSPCLVSASDTKILQIQKLPTVNAGQDGTICHNGIYPVTGNVAFAQSALWTTSGDGTFSSANSLTTDYTPGETDMLTGNALLTLTAQPLGPCSISASDGLNLVINYCHDLVIPSGWSGISTFVEPVDAALETILGDVISDLTILYSQTGVFWPGQNLNTIGEWNRLEGYTVKVASQIDLRIAGSRSANRALQLSQGWNLIPVLSECETDVVSQFAGTGVVVVKEVAGWKLYWPSLNINTLGTLQPGKSYYVLMSQPATVAFGDCPPGAMAPGKSSVDFGMLEMINAAPWEIAAPTASSHIIGIPEEVIKSSLINTGDYLGAFDESGQCYGLVRWEGESTTLTAFGDDPTTSGKDGFTAAETIYIRLFVETTSQEYDLEISWDDAWPQNDGTFNPTGLSAISAFKLGATQIYEQGAFEVLIYPNPANSVLFIDFNTTSEISVSLNDVNGREVLRQTLSGLRNQLDISALRSGVYFMKLEGDGFVKIEKIIKN